MSADGTQHSEEKTPLQAASERFNAAMARDDFEAASRHLQDMIAAHNAVSVERAAGEDDAELCGGTSATNAQLCVTKEQ